MAKYYGIDLGTTNTVVYEGDFTATDNEEEREYDPHPKLFTSRINPSFSGSSLPSVALVINNADDPTKKELLVGHDALANAAVNNKNMVIYLNTKRYMGQDEKVEFSGGYTPSDIATEFLKCCGEAIVPGDNLSNEQRAKKIGRVNVCITRPASYNMFANVATEEAARRAGFDKISLLDEPQAALLSFLYDNVENTELRNELFRKQEENSGKLNILIIDIGGGTTDVRIQSLQISERTAEEKKDKPTIYSDYRVEFFNNDGKNHRSTSNNYHGFGGVDFDNAATEHLMGIVEKEYYKKTGMSLQDLSEYEMKQVMAKVMLQAEEYKKRLSDIASENKEGYEGLIVLTNLYNNVTIDFNLPGKDYISWVENLCENPDIDSVNAQTSVFGIVYQTIQKSGYKLDDFSYVYVTGGMSQYPPLREMFKKKFKNKKVKLCFSKHALHDVARGAALYGNYFSMIEPEPMLNTNYYIDNPCGEPILLAADGTVLPTGVKVIPDFMQTVNPIEVEIAVLDGYGLYDVNLRMIKKVKAEMIIPDQRGTGIDVRYSIAENQALTLDLIIRHKDRKPEVIKVEI
uniref:Hsp70 family protein n=1 Tax=Agathobacter sp. TaxID=2021311 RepID=UPI004056A3A2